MNIYKKRESASIDYAINDFDIIIENDYTLDGLNKKVENIFNYITTKE